MQFKQTSDGLIVIHHDIISVKTLFLTLFTLVWNAVILLSIFVQYILYSSDNSTLSLVMFLKFSPYLLVGILSLYWSLLQWFNRTYIFANNEVITINYKPIPYPFFREKIIKLTKIEQLYVKQKVSIFKINNKRLHYYEMRVQKKVVLIKNYLLCHLKMKHFQF